MPSRPPPRSLTSFAEDYPDVAEGVKPLLDVLRGEIASLRAEKDAVARSVQTLGEDRLSAVYAEQEAQVIDAHPVAAEIMSDTANDRQADFIAWQQGQAEFIRRAIAENGDVIRDAPTVNRILEMYERDRGLAPAPASGNGAGNGAEPNADEARRALALEKRTRRTATVRRRSGAGGRQSHGNA